MVTGASKTFLVNSENRKITPPGPSPPPTYLIFAKTSTAPKPYHMVRGPIGNRFVDLCGNRFVDLCGNWFVDLCGNRFVDLCGNRFVDLCGNRFVDLSETGSCPAPKGSVTFSEVGRIKNGKNIAQAKLLVVQKFA